MLARANEFLDYPFSSERQARKFLSKGLRFDPTQDWARIYRPEANDLRRMSYRGRSDYIGQYKYRYTDELIMSPFL